MEGARFIYRLYFTSRDGEGTPILPRAQHTIIECSNTPHVRLPRKSGMDDPAATFATPDKIIPDQVVMDRSD
jgi:hypothetical protein